MILSKKKRNVIIVVTALLFFGALLFNLKYPLMSETSAEPGKIAQENAVNDSEDGSKTDDVKEINKAVDKQDEKDKVQEKEEPITRAGHAAESTTVKLDTDAPNERNNQTEAPAKNTTNQDKVSKPKSKPGPTPKPQPQPAPKPAPAPALKPFNVSASNSFNYVSQSTNPGKAELLIVMDSSRDDYETQLSELYNVIAPVAGSSIAAEAVSYARTKTDAYIELKDKIWIVQGRRLELGSTWGSWGVSFYSWRR